jgi:hypothetical protein
MRWAPNWWLTNDQPTVPPQTTAARQALIITLAMFSSRRRRVRCPPKSTASRSRCRRTATDSSSWLS